MPIELVKLVDGEAVNVADDEEIKEYILTRLAVTFSDDVEFLRKINKLTFGLISQQ